MNSEFRILRDQFDSLRKRFFETTDFDQRRAVIEDMSKVIREMDRFLLQRQRQIVMRQRSFQSREAALERKIEVTTSLVSVAMKR